MARLYTCWDEGMPWTPDTNNYYRSLYISLFDQVLRKVLVDGAGSAPGAGWTVTHVIDGQTISFQPPSKEFIATFVNLSPSSYNVGVRVFLSEAVSIYPSGSGANQRPIGTNVRSGYYSADTNPAGACCDVTIGNPYGISWAAVADEKTFAFYFGGFDGTDNNTASYSNESYLYLGSFNSTLGMTGLASVVMGGGNNYYGLNNASNYPYRLPWSYGGTWLRDPTTGLIVQGSGTRPFVAPFESMGYSSSLAFYGGKLAANKDIEMTRAVLSYSYPTVGYLRGVAAVPQWIGVGLQMQAIADLGQNDRASRREMFCRRTRLPDGNDYAMVGHSSWPHLLTNNPDFW